MNEWNSLKLTDCIEKNPKTSKIPKKKVLNTGKYPVVSQEKDLINGYWNDESDVVFIDQPIIVFGDHTQVLKLIDFNFVVGADGVKLLKPKPFLDAQYLYYFLQGHPVKELGYARHFRLLKELDVHFPPLPEQKRIVAILDEAFAGIEKAIANTKKNLANARELFDSYLNSVFSEKGDGWKYKMLGDLCERITKGSSPKWQGINYVQKPGVLFVTSENVGRNSMIFQKPKYVEESFNTKEAKSILQKGDVLTNIVGASIGRTAVFDRDDSANINQAVCLIRCYLDKLYNFFLSYLLNSVYFVNVLHENEINNARANLSLGFFRSLSIPLPSFEKQKMIVADIEALATETQRLESIYQQKLTALAELKQSLLQKAFSGELTGNANNKPKEAAA